MSNKIVFVSALVAALSLLAQPGVAQDSPPFHRGPWPIHTGFNHQPTQNELRALHHQDVTPDEARVIDRLYDQLMSDSEKILRQHQLLSDSETVLGAIQPPDTDRQPIDVSSKNRLSSRGS
jgi:hypothetical protein